MTGVQTCALPIFRLEADAPPAPITGSARLLPEAVNRPDWHNAYAALLLDLPRLLAALPNDKARARMLSELRQQLAASGKGQ